MLSNQFFFILIVLYGNLNLNKIHAQVNYKLRDWLFARQRYWGEPFPVIYLDDTDEIVPLLESELPLTLPELDDFTPTGTGEPPLAKAISWVCFSFTNFDAGVFDSVLQKLFHVVVVIGWLVSFTMMICTYIK